MFNPSREQVRDFFFETWRKYRAGEPLAGLETVALEIALLHPEYHAVLDDPAALPGAGILPGAGRNQSVPAHEPAYGPRGAALHRPAAGVAERFANLLSRTGERHAALHEAIDCLAEMVWRAQKDAAAPDAQAYLENLEKRARK